MFPLSRLFEFGLGMAAALAWPHLRDRIHMQSVLAWTAIEIASLLLVGIVSYEAAQHPATTVLGWWLASASLAPVAAVLILVMAFRGGIISAMLSLRPFVLLGEASYSLYLIHVLVMYAALNTIGVTGPRWIVLPAMGAVAIGASILMHLFIEQPCRRRIVQAYFHLGRRPLLAPTVIRQRPELVAIASVDDPLAGSVPRKGVISF
jgi:peptidoglycan/LPS O-acetylase OafA/YrhL